MLPDETTSLPYSCHQMFYLASTPYAVNCRGVPRHLSFYISTFAARHLADGLRLVRASLPRRELPRHKRLNWLRISMTARRVHFLLVS